MIDEVVMLLNILSSNKMSITNANKVFFTVTHKSRINIRAKRWSMK